jgi:hypothetical protein
MKEHKELQTLYEDAQDVPARRKTAHASCKKSEMQEPKPSCCEEPTRKRMRGSERRPESGKQSHPSGCPEVAPITKPRNIIHKKGGNDPSSIVQPKISDETLMNTNEGNEEQCAEHPIVLDEEEDEVGEINLFLVAGMGLNLGAGVRDIMSMCSVSSSLRNVLVLSRRWRDSAALFWPSLNG